MRKVNRIIMADNDLTVLKRMTPFTGGHKHPQELVLLELAYVVQKVNANLMTDWRCWKMRRAQSNTNV